MRDQSQLSEVQHNRSLTWGRPGDPAIDLPDWGQFAGYGDKLTIRSAKLPDFALRVTVPHHVIEFERAPVTSELSINTDRVTERHFPKGSTCFVAQGSDVYRASLDTPSEHKHIHSLVAVSFDTSLIDLLFGDLLEGRSIDFAETAAPARHAIFEKLGWTLSLALEQQTDKSGLLIESIAHQIIYQAALRWSTLPQRLRPTAVKPATQTLAKAIDYIHANLAGKVSLADVATAAGNVSVDFMTRQFKEHLGRTPYDYIILQRIELARKKMALDDKTLQQIAIECGFSSQSHLNTSFRKFTGLTPAKYRKDLNL